MRLLLTLGLVFLISHDCSAQASNDVLLQVDYPHNNGTIFSLPKVLVIYDVEGPAIKQGVLPEDISFAIDGKPVPERAFGNCAICAGPHPTILARRVPWALTDGIHSIHATIHQPEHPEIIRDIIYRVDTTVPNLTGLSGGILYPGAETANSTSIRGGVRFSLSGTGNTGLWGGGTMGFKAHGFEGGIEAIGDLDTPSTGHSTLTGNFKLGLMGQHTPFEASVGSVHGDAFGVVGYHSNPSWVRASVGAGSGRLPGLWSSVSWGPEIFRLTAEAGSGGTWNYGATLYHPYGLRASLYRVHPEYGREETVVMMSASLKI